MSIPDHLKPHSNPQPPSEEADVQKIVERSGKGPRDGGFGTWGASGTIEHRPEHNKMSPPPKAKK